MQNKKQAFEIIEAVSRKVDPVKTSEGFELVSFTASLRAAHQAIVEMSGLNLTPHQIVEGLQALYDEKYKDNSQPLEPILQKILSQRG